MAERDNVSKRVDIIGQRFGKLTVTRMIYGEECHGKKRTKCECVCDCGKTCIVLSDSLKGKRRTSCGCDTRQRRIDANRIDLTGRKFGRLTVKEMLWDYRPTRALCECDCGNTVVVIGTGLTSGKTNSCGCYQRERAAESNTKDWTGTVSDYGIELLRQSRKDKKGKWLWVCRCGVCSSEFEAIPARIMNGHITSCGCRKRSSREDMIRSVLDSLGVQYVEQYRFRDCKDRYTLPFDFAVLKGNDPSLLIEYDGRQHYDPVSIFGGAKGLSDRKRKDAIKNDYCKKHNIPLLRLPYTLTDAEIHSTISKTIYP